MGTVLPVLMPAVASLLLATCTAEVGDDGGAEPPGVDAPEIIAEEEWPDLRGETVEILGAWSPAEEQGIRRSLNMFTEATGVEVTVTRIAAEEGLGDVLAGHLAEGTPPDLAVLDRPDQLASLADEGALLSIEDTAGDLVDRHYAEVWRDLGTVGRSLYGLAYRATNASALWHGSRFLDAAGLDAPATWDDLLAASETLTLFGVTPIAIAGADPGTLAALFANVYLQQAGAGRYDRLTDGRMAWTDESVVGALETLGALVTDRDRVAGQPTRVTLVESIVQVLGEDPEAAMMFGGSETVALIESETSVELGVDATVSPFPAFDRGPPGSHVVGRAELVVLMRDTEAGRALVRWLAMPEGAALGVSGTDLLSPNRGVGLDVYPDDARRELGRMLAEAVVFRYEPEALLPAHLMGTPGTGLVGGLQELLRRPDDAERISNLIDDDARQAPPGP
jgi:alpha-glucoside transport system substrate-binding protein